jgi:hypothetical protein
MLDRSSHLKGRLTRIAIAGGIRPEAGHRRAVMLLALAGLCMLSGCGSGAPAGSGRSEHERDSIIGQSRLPGARAVRGSLEASDSAQSRRAIEDSIAAAP